MLSEINAAEQPLKWMWSFFTGASISAGSNSFEVLRLAFECLLSDKCWIILDAQLLPEANSKGYFPKFSLPKSKTEHRITTSSSTCERCELLTEMEFGCEHPNLFIFHL